MSMLIRKATKLQSRLRLAIIGPSGTGKTYSSLAIASHLGGPIVVIDTEHGSSEKYAGDFSFEVIDLATFDPRIYIEAIQAAENHLNGQGTVIIDSLSHAWMGKGGALELVDKAAQRSRSGNTFAAWKDVTPLHNALIDAIIRCRCHVIACMRAKTEYILQTNAYGKQEPVKVGMGAVQRDGMEYEFDVTAEMTVDHKFIVSKTRCKALDGAVIDLPGKQVAQTLKAWLSDGVPIVGAREPSPAPGRDIGQPTINEPGPASHVESNHVQYEPSQPEPTRAGQATTEQLARLDFLVDAAKLTDAQIRAALAKRGVSDFASLAESDAAEIIAKLEAHVGITPDLFPWQVQGDRPVGYPRQTPDTATPYSANEVAPEVPLPPMTAASITAALDADPTDQTDATDANDYEIPDHTRPIKPEPEKGKRRKAVATTG